MDRIPYPLELLTERLVIRSPVRDDAEQLMEAIAESIDGLRPWMPWADHVPTRGEAEENRGRDTAEHVRLCEDS